MGFAILKRSKRVGAGSCSAHNFKYGLKKPNGLSRWFTFALLLFIIGVGLACADQQVRPTPFVLAKELVFFDWAGDFPQSILNDFTGEYGVPIRYETYRTQEEAIDQLRQRDMYDIVVMGNDLIPGLINEGLLATIEHANVPNLKNISVNFRDLIYDPDNRYSIPYNWGTFGLLLDHDLDGELFTRWSDLWDQEYPSKVAVWELPRFTVGAALKSLGFSANSEEPAELYAALQRLLELQKKGLIRVNDSQTLVDAFQGQKTAVGIGAAADVLLARQQGELLQYILPVDGALLWGDNFVIPKSSQNKRNAELFLNFVLTPPIGAQIVNQNYYASPNEAARSFIKPEILDDPVIYPPNHSLRNAEIVLALSPTGQTLHQATWQQFLDASQWK